MTASVPGALSEGESDMRAARSKVEVSLDAGVSAGDRGRARSGMRPALKMSPGNLLREAQDILTTAPSETDPQRRRELVKAALAKAREAVGHREVTDEERAQARQVIGHGRAIENTIVEAAMRQQSTEREHETPGFSL